jgi:hypothetical protein
LYFEDLEVLITNNAIARSNENKIVIICFYKVNGLIFLSTNIRHPKVEYINTNIGSDVKRKSVDIGK